MENQKLKNESILIVDDEELWLHGISLTLERYGGTRNIIKCQDSLQVMDILSENRIGLIMLDLVMPNLSGEQLLPMIVESYPEIPVIVLNRLEKEAVAMGHDESRPANHVSFSQQLPTVQQMNRLLSEEAMRRSKGNQTIAAGMLGISQSSLSRRLKLLSKKKNDEH